MEDLNSYIILPINGNESIEFISNLISENALGAPTFDGPSSEKVFTNVQYVICENDIDNIYVNPRQTVLNDLVRENVENSKEAFECTKCKLNFTEYSQYLNHSKTHETKGHFECKICNKNFDKINSYRRHLLTHQEEKPFNCTICAKGFNSENNYKVHVALHGNSSTCPICYLSFQRTASLKSHLVTHQVEEILSCPECCSEFEDERDLKKHIKAHSYNPATLHNGLSCVYCKVKFDTPSLLKQHVASHVKVKKLVCNGKKTRKPQNIYKEYKHKCMVCSKTFPKLSLLERHTRIHTGERPFVCPICDKGFTQKGTMEIHMMKHTAVKPFCCTLCPAKFTQKCNLKVHVEKTHTAATEGEKTFKCTKCDCIFRKVASLNGHMSKIHATKDEEVTITSVIEQLKNLGDQLNGSSSKSSNICLVDTKGSWNVQGLEIVNDSSQNKMIDSREEESSRVYSLKQKVVGTNKVYVCSYCDRETKKSSDLIRHLRTHTKEKPFKCHCGKNFSLKSTLISHMQIHSGKVGKKCLKCSRILFSTKSWNLHMRKHDTVVLEPSVSAQHENGNVEALAINKERPHVDTKQSKAQASPTPLTRKGYLKGNNLIPSAESNFKCQLCSRSFTAAYLLNRHMKCHKSQKNFCCEICEKKFLDRSLFKRHITTHYAMKPYECPHCRKRFKNMLSCRKHIEIHKNVNKQEENIVFSTEEIQTLGDLDEQGTMLKISPDGIITSVDNYYITNHESITLENVELAETQTIDKSQEITTASTLEIGGKRDVKTIYLDCQQITGEENLGNYVISQLKFQPNETIVLNSSNDLNLEDSTIVFNVQTVDNNDHPSTDISDNNQFYLGNSNGELIQATLNPQQKLVLEPSEVISSNVENLPTPIQNDISDNFLADNISLYPNTQISFDNSVDTNTIPFNLITLQEKNLKLLGNNDCTQETELNTYKIQENMKLIHCLACKKIFENISLCQSHICSKPNLKDKTDSAAIDVNQLKLKDEEDTDIEKSTKTRKLVFECVHCKKKFDCRAPYVIHVNSHLKNKDGLHRCKFCDKQFKKPSDLNRHLRTHTGEKPFACDVCDKKFSLKSTLEGHYRTHNPGASKDFLCEVCNSCFSSKSSRKSHMLIHTDVKPHKCSYCDQHFRTLAHKRGHEKTHLSRSNKKGQKKNKKIKNLLATVANMAVSDLINEPSTPSQQESTGMTEIQLEFPDQADPTTKLTESIQIDPTLLQQLQNSNILLQDIESDILESPDQISENTFESLDESDILNESPENDNAELERNLECEICRKKYASKDVLRKHMQLHIKNQFVCDKCSKWFSTAEALTEHEKLHTGYRPFSCFLCTNTFAELPHLKSHLKRIHQIVDTNSPLILKMSMGETLNL